MSSRTPEECIELVVDESAGEDQREDAIHELKLANECDELASLARRDGLSERYRELALRALVTPQCDTTLYGLVEDEGIDQSIRDEAKCLLAETETERDNVDRT